MSGDLKFDFYELLTPKEMVNPFNELKQALSQVYQPVSIEKVPYRVETFSVSPSGYIYGTATRTELRDLPMLIRPTVPGVTPLDTVIEDDQGLGRPTAFLIAQRAGKLLLIFQYNHYGLRLGGFLDLIYRLSANRVLTALPIIQPDKFQEVMGWEVYRKFTAKVANPSSQEAYKTHTVAATARAAAELEAQTVGLVLGMGRGKGSLSLGSLRAAVKELLGLQKGELKSLIVTGAQGTDNRVESIDLISHRLKRKVPVPGDPRTVKIDILEAAVQQAYGAAELELEKHFGS